jgi:hypothetical protein
MRSISLLLRYSMLLLLAADSAAASDFVPSHCAAVTGTMHIHWAGLEGVAPCTGIEFTDGDPRDAAVGVFTMTGTGVSDPECIGTAAYAVAVSADLRTLEGLDTVNNIPMILTRPPGQRCFVGRWIDAPFVYVATMSAVAAGEIFHSGLESTEGLRPPLFASPNSATFSVGSPSSFTVTAVGTPTPSLALSAGTLPPNLSFTPHGNGTGTLAGTLGPGTQSTTPYEFTLTADNGFGSAVTQLFRLTAQCPTISLAPTGPALPPASFNGSYSQSFNVIGGNGASTLAVTAGALPPGVTVASNVLSGTPTDAGRYTFTLRATDAFGCQSPAQTYTLDVNLAANADAYTALGNVPVDSAAGGFGVIGNDSFPVGTTISSFAATTAGGGAVTMITTGAGMGQFTYNPPRGKASGTETFTYTLSRQGTGATAPVTASATVTFTHSGRVWFVNNAVGACGASCDGRMTNPYATIAALQADNTGLGSNPADNDVIFVHAGTGNYTGALTLRAGQRLIGQGASSTLASLGSVTAQPGQALPAMTGTRPVLTAAAATVVTLGTNNRLHGIELGAGNIALSGTNFGTLTVSENVAINTTGQALALTTGSAEATFASVSASGALGAAINGVAGTLNVSAGTIAAGAGTRVAISGGSLGGTWAGSISQSGNNFALLGISGGHSGALTFSGALTATSGTGLQFDNADGSYTFTGTTTLNGGDAGIDVLNGSGGTFSFPSTTTITNPSGSVIQISNSAPTFTYAGAFSKASTGVGITVSNNTGGTITFSGTGTKSLSTGTSNAVSLTSNGGTTITFTGGGLALTTTTGVGFNATGGATAITVQGANNTIAATGGTALNVQNTPIGASGLTFRTIAASGGANGIVLVSTGSAGGLTVTGSGAAGSGGSITNTTGPDAAIAGNGVYLSGTSAVSLDRMILSGHSNNGIYGIGVAGISIANSSVQSNGTNAGGSGEGGMYFLGLTGTSTISGTTVNQHAFGNGLYVYNTAGALSLAVTGSTFSNSDNDGILVEAHNSANVAVNISTTNFSANRGDHVQVAPNNTSVASATITGGTFSGGHPTALGQGITMRAGGSFAGMFTYDINGITINSSISYAINTGFGSTTGTGLVLGKIRNNAIGTTGMALSGSAQASCILAETNGPGTGTHTVSITGNTLRGCFDRGIELFGNRDGSNRLNVTITGNNINELNDPFSRHAIHLESGSSLLNETGTICADIANNTMTATTAVDEIRVRLRSPTTARFPGYTGGTGNESALTAYMQGRNPAGGTASVTILAPATANNTSPAGTSCPTPP